MKAIWIPLLAASLWSVFWPLAHAVGSEPPADNGQLLEQLEAAKQRATSATYRMRYQFTAGETLRWKVVHLGTTETTIQGNTQTSKVRTISTKVWRVQDIDADGNTTLVYSVADVRAWQKVSDRPEVEYDSRKDEQPPRAYAPLAKTVGVPLATVTISPSGRVLERDRDNPLNLGLGDITMPLPEEPVRVGHRWSVPDETRVRLKNGRVQRIKTRRVFRLQSVKTGVATIAMDTQVLTPVDDPRVESQLVQQLTKGTVKFDVDAGRLLSRQVDWDETVVGFQGADSLMKYLARYTEELIPATSTADRSGPALR